MQECNSCKETKPFSEFHRRSDTPSGYKYKCKECSNAYNRKHKKENPELYREYCRKWRRNGGGPSEEQKKRKIDRKRQWRKENPEIAKQYKQTRRAMKRNAEGNFTGEEWAELCNRFDNRCLACKKSSYSLILTDLGHGLTADHIVPLSKGGSNSIENIQPLCFSCNSVKGTKIIDYR